MRPKTGQVTVIDDDGVSFLPPVTLGVAGNGPEQRLLGGCGRFEHQRKFGHVLTATVALTFKPAFGSAGGREPRKAMCQWAKDTAGAGEPQSCFGLWIPEAPAPAKIPRFRLYNPVNYAHFFTASQNESDVLVGRGFSPEPSPGMVYNQPTTISGIPTQPYYRILFFPTNGAPIFHYWTRDREEYKAAVRLRGLNLGESIDSFLLSGQASGSFPLTGCCSPPDRRLTRFITTRCNMRRRADGHGLGRFDGRGRLSLPPWPCRQLKLRRLIGTGGEAHRAVLSAASHEGGSVAPGQLIRVYGRDFSKLAQAFIDGSAVPLTAVTDAYVELVVPDTVAGKVTIELFVDDLGVQDRNGHRVRSAGQPRCLREGLPRARND